MYQATETLTEQLRERWLREFGNHALAALVDRAMGDCPDLSGYYGDPLGSKKDQLRLALGAAFEAHTSVEDRIEWASRIDSDCLDWEQFTAREEGE